jgi:hypothetical protein
MENGYDIKGMTEQDVLDKVDEVIGEESTVRSSKEDPIELDDAEDIVKKQKGTVVQTYVDGKEVTVTEDDELTEEQIEEMVRESQNPIMSKEDLMEEITRQLVTEDNAYEGELESGDNPYSKHVDSETVREMGRRLYNDIRQAAQNKFGNANMNSASQAMARSLMGILQYEMDKKPQLEEEAIRLIREKHPALTDDVVEIEATITGHPDLGGRNVNRGDLKYEKGNTPPPEGYSEDELKAEVTKRRLINGMTQGSARKSQNLHHLADESRLPNRMKSEYGKLMAANDFVYWAMDRESIRQQGRSGVHAGNAKVLLPRETGTGKPRIVAEGMTFSILLHELEKGAKELIALHGTHEDMEVQRYVYDQVDHLDAEQDDIRLGVGIWEKVSQHIDIENPKHEALLFHKIVSLPADEMNSMIGGLLKDNENSVRKMEELSREASDELRDEEYGEAMGDYDEPTEEPTPAGEDEGPQGQYSDPELERILGGQQQDEPSGEPDYSSMSPSQLQDLMDDALDRGDFETASKIGPYLH